MLAWACASLPTKNALTAPDATLVEDAFRARMNILVDQRDDSAEQPHADAVSTGAAVAAVPENEPTSNVSAMQKPRRVRSKPHRDFVSSQPCLVCGRQPADAHHLRFAQPRALGRKVSDEFIVPLCRVHHRELHRVGDERGWWEKAQTSIRPKSRDVCGSKPLVSRRRNIGATPTLLRRHPQQTVGYYKSPWAEHSCQGTAVVFHRTGQRTSCHRRGRRLNRLLRPAERPMCSRSSVSYSKAGFASHNAIAGAE